MFRILTAGGLALWLAFALQSLAADTLVGNGTEIEANHYSAKANAWVEGTLTKADSDGSFTVRGAESPYARDFASFHRELYAITPLERGSQRQELLNGYGDRLKYPMDTMSKSREFNFANGTSESTAIFEEPQYGRETGTWNYRAQPRAMRYGDIKMGDRVVVGYDSYGDDIFAIWLVNPMSMDPVDLRSK